MAAAAPTAPDKLAPGTGVFPLPPDPASPHQPPIQVLYYLPEEANAASPILFVLHGLRRDSSNYFEALMASGEPQRLGVICAVPSMSEEAFPKRNGYNFGNAFVRDPARTEGPLPALRPRSEWAFTAIERCFDYLSGPATPSEARGYYLFGHSAGAQFAHRHLLLLGALGAMGLAPPPRCLRCVCANAGWYTVPTVATPAAAGAAAGPPRFPYGVGGLTRGLLRGERPGQQGGDDGGPALVAANFLQAPLLLLLGEEDTDPAKPRPEIWNNSPEAAAQGPHRLARGQNFLASGQAAARELGLDMGEGGLGLAWQAQVVPRVGHDGARMTAHAVRLLFDPERRGLVDENWDPPVGEALA